MNPLGWLWRWADRFAFVRRAGTDDASTMMHHAVICALLGGAGAAAALSFSFAPLIGFRLTWGLAWLAYLTREIGQHRGARWSWDAWGDVLLPVAWAAPTLVGGERSLVALMIASTGVGLFYTAFRPVAKP